MAAGKRAIAVSHSGDHLSIKSYLIELAFWMDSTSSVCEAQCLFNSWMRTCEQYPMESEPEKIFTGESRDIASQTRDMEGAML